MISAAVRNRFGTRRTVLLAILIAGIWAASYLRLSPGDLLPGGGGSSIFIEFLSAAIHPTFRSEGDLGFSLLPNLLDGLRATVLFAAAGTSISLVLGLILGFLGSTAWWRDDLVGGDNRFATFLRRTVAPAIYSFTRLVITVMRSVHELIWALLFLSALGLSNASAVVAIAIPYAGTFAKIFSEMIDEAPRDAAVALRGVGASGTQVFGFGLLPRALPDMSAYAFYRFECALRSSAILGFFGFPTLGYYISASFENLYYREVWTYLYALFILVILVDQWSAALRQRLIVR